MSILLSSELSLTKGRHFEMFLATFDISILTHGYESIWLNLNIVLFKNLPGDLWDKENRTELWNLTIKLLSHAWLQTWPTLCSAQNRMRSAILGNQLNKTTSKQFYFTAASLIDIKTSCRTFGKSKSSERITPLVVALGQRLTRRFRPWDRFCEFQMLVVQDWDSEGEKSTPLDMWNRSLWWSIQLELQSINLYKYSRLIWLFLCYGTSWCALVTWTFRFAHAHLREWESIMQAS